MRVWPLGPLSYSAVHVEVISVHLLVSGPSDGKGDRSREVSGVLCADTEGPEDGVRRGHPCRTLPEAETAAQEGMHATLSRRDGIKLCRMNCLPVRSHLKNDNQLGASASAGLVHSLNGTTMIDFFI